MRSTSRRARNIGFVRCFVTLLTALAIGVPGLAQALPEDASEALARAQRAASEAVVEYTRHSPDQPLWGEALGAGQEAVAAAPDHPAPRRFLAQAYLQVGWYARSWDAWQAYLDRGGTMDASVERQLLDVALWMGTNALDAGRGDAGTEYLRTVLDVAPDHLVANERLARHHLARGDAEAALPYLEALAGRVPDLDLSLEEAQRIVRYGRDATDAYAAAVEARRAGAWEAALRGFTRATDLHPEFADAWRDAAEVNVRLGRLEAAADAYERALAADPADAQARSALNRVTAEIAARQEAAERRAAAEEEARRAAAEEAARVAAEEARAAARVAAEEEARQAAEEEARQAAEAEARAAAEEEARRAAEEEAEVQAAADEAAQRAADEEARRAADEEARQAAEDEAQRAAEEEARLAAEAEARRVAEAQAAAEEEARLAAEAAAEAEAQAAAEEEARRAAEEEARRAAEAEALRAAEADEAAAADAALDAASEDGALLLADAVAEHRAAAFGAARATAFVDAPDLDRDLSGHGDDMIHLRVDVRGKPGNAPVQYQLCLVPSDILIRPACTDAGLLTLTGEGVYQTQQQWSTLAGYDAIDWRRGIADVMLVVRRPDGAPLDDADAAAGGDGAAGEGYLPMTVRVQAVAVPDDAAFPGWR